MTLDEITRDIRYHQDSARRAAREAAAHAIGIGEGLQKARKQLTAGEWVAWLDAEFGWSKRHGLRYCQLWRQRTEVLRRVGADASLRSALQALAGSDTRVTPERWLVVGFLDAPPPEGVAPLELVQQAREWRFRRG